MWRKASTFAVLLAGLLLTIPAHPAEPPTAAAARPIGQIKKVSGTVAVARGNDHLPANPGAPVYQGDVIETGPDGRVGITLADNSLFSAGPSTELAVPQFSYDARTSRGDMLANLRKGTLTVVSGEITHTTPGAMSVRTPTAVLGVRGTTFAVEVIVVGLCQCIGDHNAMRMRCVPNAHYCEMACASNLYSFVPASQSDIAACPPQERYPEERYVVLPNADGRPGSGAVTVNRGGAAMTLDQPYAAEEVRDGREVSVSMNAADTQNIFQDALAAQPALPAHFRLNFELDSTQTTSESAALYRMVLAEIKKRQAYEVELVGHTDLLADDAHNKRLSFDRAVAVRGALVRDGVDAQAIDVDGRGDAEPLIRTGRGVAEPRNRRVEITVR